KETCAFQAVSAKAAVKNPNLVLLIGRRCWHRRRRFLFRRGYRGLFQEEAVIVEVAIQPAGDLGGFRAEGGASAAQEDDGDDLAVVGVCERGEPAEAGPIFGAGAGLA